MITRLNILIAVFIDNKTKPHIIVYIGGPYGETEALFKLLKYIGAFDDQHQFVFLGDFTDRGVH